MITCNFEFYTVAKVLAKGAEGEDPNWSRSDEVLALQARCHEWEIISNTEEAMFARLQCIIDEVNQALALPEDKVLSFKKHRVNPITGRWYPQESTNQGFLVGVITRKRTGVELGSQITAGGTSVRTSYFVRPEVAE